MSTDSSLDHMRESVGRVGLQSDLEQTVWRKLQEGSTDPLQDCELDVCQVISSCGYKDMLENLFHNVDNTLPDVPILTKAYEERLMRQPMSGETPCAMGDLCECQFIDKRMPFTAVELRFPNDPPTAQMCVVCCRKTTQKLFFDMCFTGKRVKGVIQRCVALLACSVVVVFQAHMRFTCAPWLPRALTKHAPDDAGTATSSASRGSTPPSACSSAPPRTTCPACPCPACRTSETSTRWRSKARSEP